MTIVPVYIPCSDGNKLTGYMCNQRHPRFSVCVFGTTREEAVKKAIEEITRPF